MGGLFKDNNTETSVSVCGTSYQPTDYNLLKYSVPQTRLVNFVRRYTRVRIARYSDFCDVHKFSKPFVTISDDFMLQFVSLCFSTSSNLVSQ